MVLTTQLKYNIKSLRLALNAVLVTRCTSCSVGIPYLIKHLTGRDTFLQLHIAGWQTLKSQVMGLLNIPEVVAFHGSKDLMVFSIMFQNM